MTHSFQLALREICNESLNRHPNLSEKVVQIIDLLETTVIPNQNHAPLSNPLEAHLSRFLDECAVDSSFINSLKSLNGRHFWSHLTDVDARFEGFSKNLTHSEIIGPTGMFKHEGLNIGIMIQAPNFFYAPHTHDCIELYCILSGSAYWKVGEDPWLPRKADEWITHERNQIHAMRTGDDPLIALYAYYGNPTSSFEFCDEDFHGLPQ